MLGRLTGWLGGSSQEEPFPPEAWDSLVARLPLLDGYSPGELARLRELATEFLRRKSFHGAGGLEVNDEMRRVVAVQACVPVLNLGLDGYRGWYSVVLYPDEFVARHEWVDEDGVAHEADRELSGESWPEGPAIFSWTDVELGADGEEWGNVVVHEMAHKLDLLNGEANGMPPLHAGMSREAWTTAFSSAYEDFWHRVDRDEEVPFDDYAADDPGEFFAVLSEAFFLHPDDVKDAYPDVYAQLAAFYRQDPARRLSLLWRSDEGGG